jgi:glycosyltransferase involved in cell wall biosynthesis
MSEPSPRFSVVIPVHDGRRKLRDAVNSVLDQSFSDFEILVVDDDSPIDPRLLLSGFDDDRIRYVVSRSNGPSASRNAGISSARGEVITFLDSDDRAETDWLMTFDREMKPHVGLVSCGAIYKAVSTGSEKAVLPKARGAAYRRQRVLFIAGTFAYLSRLSNGNLFYDSKLHQSENAEFGIRLVRRCAEKGLAAVAVDETLVIVNKGDRSRHGEARIDATERILTIHEQLMREDREMGRDYAAVAGVQCARFGRWREARRWFWKAVEFRPGDPTGWIRIVLTLVPFARSGIWRASPRPGVKVE